MTDFVNPYTFVPLPQKVVRRQSPGHDPGPDEAPERYVGALEVTWHIQSPIAIPTEEWGSIGGDVRIPGSSIKGAVRSTHEMLFGGCLRQVDLGYRPTYRQLPNMDALKDWRMAVVLSEDEVLLCEEEKKRSSVDSETLRQRLGGKARTGDVIAVNSKNDWKDKPERRVAERFQVRDRPADASGYENLAGCYVVLITKEGARHETATVKGKKVRTKWYWSLGKLTRERATISSQAKRDFSWAMMEARPDGERWIDVFRGKTKLGQARGNKHALEPGSVIWVKVRDGKVTAIKLSQFWRERSKECLGNRIPQETRPCDDENLRLCPSCSVFGSADTLNDKADTDERRREGDQRSYAAHVRFGSAVGIDLQGDEVTLAPLGQPHLGAGLTYLEPTPSAPTPKSRDMRQSRWDSDGTQKRQLRGRKFYWHSNPERQLDHLQHTQGVGDVPGRHLKREHHGAEMCTKAQLVTGGTFRQTITFDGLDQFGVASLLAALQPGRLLGDGEFALHLGRGKPLGLGSVTAEITAARITTVAARYGDKAETPLETFVIDPAEVKDRCGDLDAVHEGARKVLHLDGLGENWWKVTYPTCEVWQQFGSKEFDESFKFFKDFGGPAKSDGKKNASWKPGAWKPMPEITDHDQSDWSAK
ncbi:TIGR03986 family CRISPR-associated RAMP protein [Arachnia propionica]|uniref:TIGR03986 family CRISPR-associated RAMP protein n=1 Tax=Arachnia propionica TaxID=1750 RepID=A0AB37HWZ3_9ACTN|nr:TIGR03986 family CRISPR-associated RAMP protein [Arachnia propionica]QCT36718.1 TIGR03986 family CRISPR-associated RAMP protein [Arachnia propionica]QUC10947.1 TIGR03986 family CRISPR-associated RAMP protein [Arachnia propionica]RPA19370.1 TIGR03986 family CRISPR-associated RAMP protein [Arachnia propionica]